MGSVRVPLLPHPATSSSSSSSFPRVHPNHFIASISTPFTPGPSTRSRTTSIPSHTISRFLDANPCRKRTAMDSTELQNPHIRNGPSCDRFQSTIQITINWSFNKLPATATVIAEVLTIQPHFPSHHRDYVIDLTISKIRRCRLNSSKFIIRTGNRVFTIFCNTTEDADSWADVLAHSSSHRFSNYYRLGKQIADGRHSKVYLAHPNNDDDITYVVKVNNRSAERNGFSNRSQFERDAHLQLTRRQASPRAKKISRVEKEASDLKFKRSTGKIVTLRDSFGTPTEDFLVFRYQDGDILSAAISKYGPLSESDACMVMWDLLSAVHFMHARGVVHRDVRASNVFYWNREGSTRAKLFDLSEARQIPDGISGEEAFRDNPGKGQYKALEILSGRYHGKPADMWSCGVLLYKMLSGSYPFQGENEQELSDNIIDVALKDKLFNEPVWASVSKEAMLLIKQMLQHDPLKRPCALEARSHKWLSDHIALRQAQVNAKQGSRGRRPRSHRSPLMSQRLETPATRPRRATRSSTTCDPGVLPAPYNPHSAEDPLAPAVNESRAGRVQGLKRKLCMGTERKGVASGDNSSSASDQSRASNGSSDDTAHGSGDDDAAETKACWFIKKLRKSGLSLAVELARTGKFGCNENIVTKVKQKLTKLQAAVKDFVERNGATKGNTFSGTHTNGKDKKDGQDERAFRSGPILLIKARSYAPLTRKYPDRERNIDAFKDSGLTHRMEARRNAYLRLGSTHKRPATPPATADDSLTMLTSNAFDGSQGKQKIIPAGGVLPTNCLDDIVSEGAKDTKLSDISLDSLCIYRGSSSTDIAADTREREKEILMRTISTSFTSSLASD